jgi:hypothetical protein
VGGDECQDVLADGGVDVVEEGGFGSVFDFVFG